MFKERICLGIHEWFCEEVVMAGQRERRARVPVGHGPLF